MVYISERPHGYSSQHDEKGRYLMGQISGRVGKRLIRVRSLRGIEWYRSLGVLMPVAPSRQNFESGYPGELKYKRMDNPSTSGRTASGQSALNSARRGKLNSIGLEVSACL